MLRFARLERAGRRASRHDVFRSSPPLPGAGRAPRLAERLIFAQSQREVLEERAYTLPPKGAQVRFLDQPTTALSTHLPLFDTLRRNLSALLAALRGTGRDDLVALADRFRPLAAQLAEEIALELVRPEAFDPDATAPDLPPARARDLLSAVNETLHDVEAELFALGLPADQIAALLGGWIEVRLPWDRGQVVSGIRDTLSLEQALATLARVALDARPGAGTELVLPAVVRVVPLVKGDVEVRVDADWEWTVVEIFANQERVGDAFIVCAPIEEVIDPFDRDPVALRPLVRIDGGALTRVRFRALRPEETVTARPPESGVAPGPPPQSMPTAKVAAGGERAAPSPMGPPVHLTVRALPKRPIPRED